MTAEVDAQGPVDPVRSTDRTGETDPRSGRDDVATTRIGEETAPVPRAPLAGPWAGRRLLGYVVLERVGRGGMGVVFVARHVHLDKLVALKVLPSELFADESAVARFEREMRAIGRLDHPNIVSAHDAGSSDGVHFLVMERLEGSDLAALLRERGPLRVADACEVVRQAALGLQHAHEMGLVHRDVKPSNLFLTRSGVVKVLDLGLARFVEESAGDSLTSDGQAMGTIDYMAPEQWADARAVDVRADIYSLGCTLFALIAGSPPFSGVSHASRQAKIQAHLREGPPSLRERRPEVPEALADVVSRLMAKGPDGRPPEPAAVALAVAPFCEGSDLGSLVLDPGPAAPAPQRAIAPAAVPAPAPSADARPPKALVVDDDVRFTVYRPRVVAPSRWAAMLVFAHLSANPPDAPEGAPDPVEEVARQAERLLGPRAGETHQATTQESASAVPRDEMITLVPVVDGVTFNPARRQFRWVESVHREEFRLVALPALDGKTARGRLSVFLGSLLIAEVVLSVRVDSGYVDDDAPAEKNTGTRFRRLYASYASEDRPVARQFERLARMLGDEYQSRGTVLRSGDGRLDRVQAAIESSDVFQLFWSSNAMRSAAVEHEWRHALSLGRPQFVRPVYWEEPLPIDPTRNLPPDELRQLHFQKLGGHRSSKLARVRSTKAHVDAVPEPPSGDEGTSVRPSPGMPEPVPADEAEADLLSQIIASTRPVGEGVRDELSKLIARHDYLDHEGADAGPEAFEADGSGTVRGLPLGSVPAKEPAPGRAQTNLRLGDEAIPDRPAGTRWASGRGVGMKRENKSLKIFLVIILLVFIPFVAWLVMQAVSR